MTHDEKVSVAIKELTAKGVGKNTSAPPIFRLAWKLGITVPPPLFLSFGYLMAIMGIWFGVIWGVVMWFTIWRRQSYSVEAAIFASVAAGVFFGLAMASYFRWKAQKLGLPAWRDYKKTG